MDRVEFGVDGGEYTSRIVIKTAETKISGDRLRCGSLIAF